MLGFLRVKPALNTYKGTAFAELGKGYFFLGKIVSKLYIYINECGYLGIKPIFLLEYLKFLKKNL